MKRLGFALLSCACAALVPTAIHAQTALDTMSERVESSLQVYRDQSARIAEEKIPLIREINRLEDENVALRESIDRALVQTADNNRAFDALRNQLEELSTQTGFATRFLQEYLDGFESRIHVAEDQHYKDRITAIRLALEQPNLTLKERFEAHLDAVEIGLERAEQTIGGYSFQARAIGPGGVVAEGTINVLGPAAYFHGGAASSPVSGLLAFHSGTLEPAVVAFEGPSADRVRAFSTGEDPTVPLDASLGSAVNVRAANIRIVDHIAQGGPVGYAILGLGAVALVLSLVKLMDLGRFRSIDSRTLGAIIQKARAGDEAAALATVKTVRGPVGDMLELGVRNIRASSVLLEELMLSVILRKRPEMERYLPFLAITAAAAPLLGLLGTVVGMIRTFALITVFGTGDPRALSSGISEALVTTELGLMVAIPTLVLHGVFTRMIRSRFGDMERLAFEFVKTISLEQSKDRSS
ncbi:hypothetical protein ASA1KI_29990 [Opitutales bacterium ASA1]|nr:hypothetical protein ASA1KI_29990 [Opitutales bacterium ASA1]